ncbi:hypothetical protein [Nocardia sp. CC201C]|uniref:hypothetical protein n=1 Tax=Nocardia sp. CC201C TaxID=3044575 RepID=UPI0024A8E0B4|nr:hypothetical protein [Nocardia sp. CC201C]
MDWLKQSRGILDFTISEILKERSSIDGLVYSSPDDEWAAHLTQLLNDVRHDLVLTISSPVQSWRAYRAAELRVTELIKAGKNVRLLMSSTYIESRKDRPQLERSPFHPNIRVADTGAYNTITIDRKMAVLWGSVGGGDPIGIMVTEPTLVGVIHQFTTKAWKFAPDLRTHSNAHQRQLDDITLAIVNHLQTGLKDESAAKMLAVSVRTYRRYVAEVMAQLGVTTRFQLGVRASELGLLQFDPGLRHVRDVKP